MDPMELKPRIGLSRALRLNHENAVQEISDLAMPYRGDITTVRAPGDDRLEHIGVFDSTGILAADGLVNFLKSTIFPTNVDWLKLSLEEDFDRSVRSRAKADITARRILRAISGSNFYSEADQWMRDDSVLGTGTMFPQELSPAPDDGSGNTWGGVRFKAVPWGSIWLLPGNDDISMVVRDLKISAIEAKREFGTAGSIGEKFIRDGSPMEMVRYTNVAWRNENGIPGGLRHPEDMPWVSHWVLEDSDGGIEILRTRGQDLNPYLVARWMVVDGEVYGRGQGHFARPDMKGVNKLKELTLDAAGVDLKPPFLVEDETQIDLDIGPGGTIVTRAPQKLSPQFLPTGARYDIANAIGFEDRNAIRRAFLADLIDDPESQDRSAAAVRDRQVRTARRLAPRSDRIYSEMMVPLVAWMMNRMSAAGALPELDELAQEGARSMKIEFVSPFFTAQKEAPLVRLQGWIDQWKVNAIELQRPEVLDFINLDRAVTLSSQLSDIPAEVLNDEREVAEIRQRRQEEIDRQRGLDQAQQATEIAQNAQGVAVG